MENVLWIIWEYIINCYDCALIIFFLSVMLKHHLKRSSFYLFVIALALILLLINIYITLINSFIIFTLIVFLFAIIFLKSKFISKLFWVFFCQTTFYGVDLLYGSLVTLVLGDLSTSKHIDSGTFRFMSMLITRIIIGLAIVTITRKDFFQTKLTVSQTLFLELCPFLSCVALLLLVRFFFESEADGLPVAIIGLLICIVNGLIFYLFRSLSIQSASLEEKKLMLQRSYFEKELFKKELLSFESVQGVKHDLHNHLSTIHTLASQAKTKEVMMYIDQLNSEFERKQVLFLSEDIAINSILNNKVATALANDIKIDLQLAIPTQREITMTDFCSLLGNLWDNAIEANCKISNVTKRYINFTIKQNGHFNTINCINASPLNPQSEDPLRSEKKDSGHGLGIKQIKRITKKYGGIFDYKIESGSFVVNIFIPIPKQEIEPNIIMWSSKETI